MPNKLIYPSMNCLQMFLSTLDRDDRYNSKTFDDWDFPETVLPWEQSVNYRQPWQLNDTIQLQLQTNIGPVNFILKTCDGATIDTIQFDQKQQSVTEPGLFIYECSVPLSGYSAGYYYVEIDFGGGVFVIRSGVLDFATLHANTLLSEFKHVTFREDIIFETGFFPSLRFHGTLKFDRSPSKKTVYEDQVLNELVLRSQKFRKWILSIGGSKGIPDYLHDTIAGIIGCSDFRIDGKYFTCPADADLEPNSIDNYPMRGWKVDLRERYTRGARVYENDEPIDGELVVMVNVDSKGFGNSNSGSQTAVIDVN